MKRLMGLLLLLSMSVNCYASSVAQWKMNDNAATTAVVDSVGSNNGTFGDATGDPCTAAHSTTGQINEALTFDGTDDYIAVSDSNSLDVTAITMSAWIYLDSGWSANGYILAKLEDVAASGEISYTMHITDARKVALGISDDGDDAVAESSNDAISKSTWHHVVGTYDTGTYKIYVDGSLVGSTGIGNANGTIHVGTGRLTIGARYDSSDVGYKVFFNGKIDNVIIFDTALAATEVEYIYNRGRGTENISSTSPRLRTRRRIR